MLVNVEKAANNRTGFNDGRKMFRRRFEVKIQATRILVMAPPK
jgi:hypothetical protein